MPTGSRDGDGPVAPVLEARIALHYLGCAEAVPGGVATRGAVGPFVEALAEQVASVTLVAYDPPGEAADVEDLVDYVVQAPNVDVTSLGPKGGRTDAWSRRRRVGRVVSQASAGWDVLVMRLVNRRAHLVFDANTCDRVVSIVGGYAPEVARSSRGSLARRAKLLATAVRSERHVRRILRSSGVVLPNSEMLLERYRRVAPHAQILRTPTRSAELNHVAEDRLTRVPRRLLVAGRLSPDKGVLEAVEAFARIREVLLPDAELHVVGQGEARQEMAYRAAQRGVGEHVVFHGWVQPGPELFAHFRQADVYLMLSHAESLPRTVWEAMAHSVLVVSSPVGSLPLTFEDGRELVFTADRSPHSVEAAVRRLLDDAPLRRGILQRAYERAQNESSTQCIARQFVNTVTTKWPELSTGRRR